jgi:hypothetical protein
VVPYKCEIWSLALWEEYRVIWSENKVLRRIFGPRRDEVAGGWIKLHNELHNVKSLESITRMMKNRRMG